MMRRWWIVFLVVLAPVVQAATVHAFLDRSQVSLGDTITLNITSSGPISQPDLSALQGKFAVLGTSRSRSVEIVNGKSTSTSQLGIALKPLTTGTLTIPALSIGGALTAPLSVVVSAAPSGGQGKVGDAAFMQASVLSNAPYQGQQTVYSVRLFLQPGVQGSLSDPHADGARLVPLDRNHRSMVQRNGYAYELIERSWALIPERSGTITVHGPVFTGQNLGAGRLNQLFINPNALLNTPLSGLGAPVHASAPVVTIAARAVPAGAGKPWLPARNIQLQLAGLPSSGEVQAGVPLTLTLQVTGVGVPADALPEPELPVIAGARVYPDQTQDKTDASGEWLRGTRTRSFAIIPDGSGTLTLPALTLDWWDVVNHQPEQAKLPAHALRVSAAAAGSSAPPASPRALVSRSAPTPVVAGGSQPRVAGHESTSLWRGLAIASLALWLLVVLAALAWWLRRRGGLHAGQAGTATAAADALATPDGDAGLAPVAGASGQSVAHPALLRPRELQRNALAAAQAGDVATCARALSRWARAVRPAVTRVDALQDALGDRAQREALAALQRARWKGGDAAAACAQVAAAFANGFVWQAADAPAADPDARVLPPLYPP